MAQRQVTETLPLHTQCGVKTSDTHILHLKVLTDMCKVMQTNKWMVWNQTDPTMHSNAIHFFYKLYSFVSPSTKLFNRAHYAGNPIWFNVTVIFPFVQTHWQGTKTSGCGSPTYLHPSDRPVCRVCSGPICVVSTEQIWQVISRAERYLYLSLSSPSFSSHSLIPIVFALSLWPHHSAFLFTGSTCSLFSGLFLSFLKLKKKKSQSPSSRLCLHLLQPCFSLPQQLSHSERHLTLKLQTRSVDRWRQTVPQRDDKHRDHPAAHSPFQIFKHLLTQWFLQWRCVQPGAGSWLQWSSACHVCPPGILRCQRSRSPPAGRQHSRKATLLLWTSIASWTCK